MRHSEGGAGIPTRFRGERDERPRKTRSRLSLTPDARTGRFLLPIRQGDCMREFASDPPVEDRVGDALRGAGASVAVAESCTGGLIGSLLTDVPGSSAYFDRALVTYSYDAKLDVLGVSRESLDAYGAVSEPVASEMAAGVRGRLGRRDHRDRRPGRRQSRNAGRDGLHRAGAPRGVGDRRVVHDSRAPRLRRHSSRDQRTDRPACARDPPDRRRVGVSVRP